MNHECIQRTIKIMEDLKIWYDELKEDDDSEEIEKLKSQGIANISAKKKEMINLFNMMFWKGEWFYDEKNPNLQQSLAKSIIIQYHSESDDNENVDQEEEKNAYNLRENRLIGIQHREQHKSNSPEFKKEEEENNENNKNKAINPYEEHENQVVGGKAAQLEAEKNAEKNKENEKKEFLKKKIKYDPSKSIQNETKKVSKRKYSNKKKDEKEKSFEKAEKKYSTENNLTDEKNKFNYLKKKSTPIKFQKLKWLKKVDKKVDSWLDRKEVNSRSKSRNKQSSSNKRNNIKIDKRISKKKEKKIDEEKKFEEQRNRKIEEEKNKITDNINKNEEENNNNLEEKNKNKNVEEAIKTEENKKKTEIKKKKTEDNKSNLRESYREKNNKKAKKIEKNDEKNDEKTKTQSKNTWNLYEVQYNLKHIESLNETTPQNKLKIIRKSITCTNSGSKSKENSYSKTISNNKENNILTSENYKKFLKDIEKNCKHIEALIVEKKKNPIHVFADPFFDIKLSNNLNDCDPENFKDFVQNFQYNDPLKKDFISKTIKPIRTSQNNNLSNRNISDIIRKSIDDKNEENIIPKKKIINKDFLKTNLGITPKEKPIVFYPIRRDNRNNLTRITRIERIENYSLGPILGQGAYANVRLAIDQITKEKFAIKTYEKYKLLDIQKKNNVRREINILEMLDHPNIVKLIKTIDSTKCIYLVMEYAGKTSLSHYVKTQNNFKCNEIEAKFIFKQIVEAVHYMHNNSIIHRDIKLENILLEDNNFVKIIDFGFAMKFNCYNSNNVKTVKNYNMFCGTPSYMAPEIVNRKEYFEFQTDIWALGITLFVMLNGKFPFKGQNDSELFKQITKGELLFDSQLSSDAKELITEMLVFDPKQRISTTNVQNIKLINFQILESPWFK